MISIDPNTLSDKENYKFLIGSIIPRPIAFVTSFSREGVVNGAPFSYFNIVAFSPPLVSLSVQRKEGIRKDTANNIIQNNEFVVHIVDQDNVEQINATASSLPPEESELTLAGLTAVGSTKISVPGIREAKIRFECVLEKHLEFAGNNGEPTCDLLIGRVVQYHIENQLYEQGRIDQDKLGAVSRLAGNDYAKIGEVFSIKRPK